MAATRLAAPVLALSVMSDLAKGFGEGQALRTAVLAARLGEAAGAPAEVRSATYWVGLLRFAGCTATASEMAAELDDEIAVSATFATVDPTDLLAVVRSAFRLHPGRPDRVVGVLRRAPSVITRHEVASCEVAALFARTAGLPDAVSDGLAASFERWDGKGHPGRLRGTEVPMAARIAQVAQLAELVAAEEPAAVRRLLSAMSGRALDPELAALAGDRLDLVSDLDAVRPSDALAAEPPPRIVIDERMLDGVCRAIGALVDLKSPYLIGHSQRVADVGAAAAIRYEMGSARVKLVRRAGWLHDVGRAGVSSRIWDKPGPLTAAEREQARLHPYYTRRVLASVPDWTELSTLAGAHHERLNGSGYPDGIDGFSSAEAAILAAADLFVRLGEPQPYRAALADDQRRRQLTSEVEAGRLDPDAVAAVLAEDGSGVSNVSGRTDARAELTGREREILELVAQGLTNKAIGSRLSISAKTVNTHLEHSYTKLGVSCRAAAVYAITRG